MLTKRLFGLYRLLTHKKLIPPVHGESKKADALLDSLKTQHRENQYQYENEEKEQ